MSKRRKHAAKPPQLVNQAAEQALAASGELATAARRRGLRLEVKPLECGRNGEKTGLQFIFRHARSCKPMLH